MTYRIVYTSADDSVREYDREVPESLLEQEVGDTIAALVRNQGDDFCRFELTSMTSLVITRVF